MSAEKRLFLFIVLTTALLASHALLNQWLAPPPQPRPDKAPAAENLAADKTNGGATTAPADNSPPDNKVAPQDADTAQVEKPAGRSEQPSDQQQAEQPKTAPEAPAPEPQTRWVVLGSFGSDAPSRLMAVFTSRGAALERLELVERTAGQRLRYRSMDERQGGYLGYLALRDDRDGGCRIHVVPPGTPAALAEPTSPQEPVGLQVGDRLLEIGGQRVASRREVADVLLRTKPRQRVEIVVQRGDRSLRYTALLADQPLALISPESPAQVGPGPNPPAFRCSLAVPGSLTGVLKNVLEDPGLATAEWQVTDQSERSVTFEWSPPDGQWRFRKRFELASAAADQDHSYHLDLHFEVFNQSSTARVVPVRWEGPNGLPTEGWWYSTKVHHKFFGVAGARDLIWSVTRGQQLRSASEIYRELTGDSVKPVFAANAAEKTTPVRFVGIDTQYFAVVCSHPDLPQGQLLQTTELSPHAWGDLLALPKDRIKLTNVSFLLTMAPQTVEPGQSVTQTLRVFAGPKEPVVLSHYELSDVLYYGWFPWVAKPLGALLHAFYTVVRNYGLAIILLTVIVRAGMFPISRKAAQNAAKMQELAPELKRIAEKYKNDPQKRLQAQQQLYREHNFNPFSGCLLMFVQLPIFIGLYRCLAVDIHLRQAPLIPGINWCSNLAGPDMLWRWPLPEFLASETGWLGPYLNVLPILTIALFLFQQKLFTPPPTDEQQRVQQQMMTFMMVFIGIMFFKVPSGLCIYFIASSLWSVAERLWLPKSPAAAGTDRKVEPAGQERRRRNPLIKAIRGKRK